MTTRGQRQEQKQIPFGDDNQEGNGKNRSRSPSGMTTKRATARTGNDNVVEGLVDEFDEEADGTGDVLFAALLAGEIELDLIFGGLLLLQ